MTNRFDSGDIWPSTLPREEFTELQERIIRHVVVHPDQSPAQIALEVGCSRVSVQKAIGRARELTKGNPLVFDLNIKQESAAADGHEDEYKRGEYIANKDHLQRSGLENKDLGVNKASEAYCKDCGNRITVGSEGDSDRDGFVEYGHQAGDKLRCSHRPTVVESPRGNVKRGVGT